MSLDLSSDVSTPTHECHRPLRRRLGTPRTYVAPVPAVNPYADSKAMSRQRTGLARASLRAEGWSLTQDVRQHHGLIEHIVIGTAGCYVVDSHAAAGSVRIAGDQVTMTVPGLATRTFPS